MGCEQPPCGAARCLNEGPLQKEGQWVSARIDGTDGNVPQ